MLGIDDTNTVDIRLGDGVLAGGANEMGSDDLVSSALNRSRHFGTTGAVKRRMRSRRVPAVLSALFVFAPAMLGGTLGCKPKGATADRLMAGTTVGQNRCSEVDPTQRPFVVEWDATDTAMFESVAERDVVFVRYVGCELEVLTACNDDGMAGRYGAYNPPTWTTGSVEGFDVRDEYDLYAKLPLGASSFAGKVAGGATLKLQYYISGTVTATRNAIGLGDLAGNQRCEGATHFVQAYNLGAFELDATQGSEQRVEASHKGVGVGGGHSRSDNRLKQGGDLTTCTSDEARELTRCKLPIRLVLRELDEGNAQALAAPTAGEPVLAGTAKPGSAQAVAALYDSALRKMGTADGKGCLDDLDRVRQLDGAMDERNASARAQCEMLVGRCDEGKRRYRKWLQSSSSSARQTAGEIDASVDNAAMTYCPASSLQGQAKAVKLSQEIETAKRRPDAPTCARLGHELAPLVTKMKRRDKIEEGQHFSAIGALSTAAGCADELGRCKDAKKLLRAHVDANPLIQPADRAATVASMTKRLGKCAG